MSSSTTTAPTAGTSTRIPINTTNSIYRRPIPRPPLRSRKKSNIVCNNVYNKSILNDDMTLSYANYTGTTSPLDCNKNENENSSSRKLFQTILLKRKESLTNPEQNYLEILSQEGMEDELNTAMMVLSDGRLFPRPIENIENLKKIEDDVTNDNDVIGDIGLQTPILDKYDNHDNDLLVNDKELHHEDMIINIDNNTNNNGMDDENINHNDDVEVSQSCLFSFTSFGGNRNKDNGNNDENDIIQNALNVEKDKIQTRLGLLNGTKRLLQFTKSNNATPDENNNDCDKSHVSNSSTLSYENVEIIQMAGRPIVLQDLNNHTQVSVMSDDMLLPGDTTSPNSVVEYTPTRSNKSTGKNKSMQTTNLMHEQLNNEIPSLSSSQCDEMKVNASNMNIGQSNTRLSFTTPPEPKSMQPINLMHEQLNNEIPSLSSSQCDEMKVNASNMNIGHTNTRLSFTTPPEPKVSSLSIGGSSLGSNKRMSIVAERKHSKVRTGLWKAHQSGISLSPSPRRSISPSIPLNRYIFDGQHQQPSTKPPSSALRKAYAYQHHRKQSSLTHLLKNRLSLPMTASSPSIKNQNSSSSVSSIPSIQAAHPLTSSNIEKVNPLSHSNNDLNNSFSSTRSSGTLLTFPGASHVSFSNSELPSFRRSQLLSSTQQLPSLGSLNSYPSLQPAPAFQSSASLRDDIDGGLAFHGTDSLPSCSLLDSAGSLRLASPLSNSSSSISKQFSTNLERSMSDTNSKSKHSRDSSVKFLDLETEKKKWMMIEQDRVSDTLMARDSNSNNDVNVAKYQSIDSLDLAYTDETQWLNLQKGKTGCNSLIVDSLKSSYSSASLDLASSVIYFEETISSPSSFDILADSSKSFPSIRQAEPIFNNSVNSILKTIRSGEVEEDFRETITPPFQSKNLNKSMMRGRNIMSFASSKSSLDDSFLVSSSSNLWMKPGIAFDDSDLRSCKSDESSVYVTENIILPPQCSSEGDDLSWDTYPRVDEDEKKFDAWNVLTSEYDEYGFGRLEFGILGTSADDVDSQPHVLSPPLMESLFQFVPFAVSEQNFWMKYSLLRDGASFFKLLQNVRGSKATLIAMETVEGEVFGSFTSTPWRKHTSFFGSGESFLWRMRNDRKTECKSIIDQAKLESEIEVFPWTGDNYLVQLCTDNQIAVGGGGSSQYRGHGHSGFGLCIDDQVLHGTSSYCPTFENPPLSKEHQDGSPFEIVNLEVWTFTPAMTVEEAEKIEFGRLFLELNRLQ